jgi:hypothetical protein
MYNPFPLLTPAMLISQISGEKAKRYFVRQTFERGMTDGSKAAFLLRAYSGDEKEMAEQHFARLQNDPNAFLYDAKMETHSEKLKIAARQPSGFKIYYVGKTKLEWKPPLIYQNKMKRYLQQRHPAWRTSRGKNKVMIGLLESYGDIYLKFNFGYEEDQIPFDEIEKY